MIDKDFFDLIFVIAFFLICILICSSVCTKLCRRNTIYRSQSTANIIPTGAQQSSSIQDIGSVSSSTIPPAGNQIFPPYPASSVLITTPCPANPPPVNPYMAAALNSHTLYQEALPPPYSDVVPYPYNPTGQVPCPPNPTGCTPYPVNVSQYPPNQPFVSTTWSQPNPPYPVNPQMPYDISQASAPAQRFK